VVEDMMHEFHQHRLAVGSRNAGCSR
jgi:hypothetical protein